MPNVKIYLDETALADRRDTIAPLLAAIRDQLCDSLGVAQAACHIVLFGVTSAPGQTPVNIELVLLRNPDRPRDRLALVCAQLRDLVADHLHCRAAVRCATMEPDHYIVAR